VPLAPFGQPLGYLWPSWGIWSLLEVHKNTCKIIDVDYREICQIHETVIKNQLLEFAWRTHGPAGLAEELLGPPGSTRAGGQDDVSFTNSLK